MAGQFDDIPNKRSSCGGYRMGDAPFLGRTLLKRLNIAEMTSSVLPMQNKRSEPCLSSWDLKAWIDSIKNLVEPI